MVRGVPPPTCPKSGESRNRCCDVPTHRSLGFDLLAWVREIDQPTAFILKMKRSDDRCEPTDSLCGCRDLNLGLFGHSEWIKHQYRHRNGLTKRIGKWRQRVFGPDHDLVNI